MSLVRSGIAVFLFIVSAAVVGHAQDEKSFPTDDEINLLVTQTERAVQQYKPLIDQEELQFGKSGADLVAKDRQVVHALEVAVKALKVNPQGFNGSGGFAFFEWLDDADRNALLCASASLSDAAVQMMAGNATKANELIHLGHSCMDVSALIYTVSENAGSLYLKYVEAQERLAGECTKLAKECTNAVKKMPARKK